MTVRGKPLTRAQKADVILSTLDELFPQPAIPLRHRDPYTLLVAVVLSAQCTDARVNEVTPVLFAPGRHRGRDGAADRGADREDHQALRAGPHQGEEHPRDLPHPRRAVRGGGAAQTSTSWRPCPESGTRPRRWWCRRPSASPPFRWTPTIHRLAYRWGLSTGKNVVQTEKDLKRTFPEERWNDLHKQIIYFGRQYCPARGHDPEECVLCRVVGRRSLFARR